MNEQEMNEQSHNSHNSHNSRNWLDKLALFLATGFGVGFIPVMPGTFGSLWGPLLVWGLTAAIPEPLYWMVCGVLIAIGLPICARAGKVLGLVDPGSIVYDEIVAFPLVFAFVSVDWTTAVLGFLWFRLFDILKPWPIKRFEKLPGAYGVMADDLVAGIIAGAALWGSVELLGL